MADLAEAPADAGPLLDDRPGLLGGAGWVRLEVLLQGGLVFDQGASGMMAWAATQAGQAPLEVLVQVALDAATGDIGGGGDVVVAEAVALEPEDLHLPLDPRVGVMVTVVGQFLPVFCWEGEGAHDGDSMLSSGRSPSVVYLLARPPTICARPGRAEYT